MECRPVVCSADRIGRGVCLLSLRGLPVGEPGQSCRLSPAQMHNNTEYAELPLFYTDEKNGVSAFLFPTESVICRALAGLLPGEALAAEGPCGTPLPRFWEDILLIGEGVLCAPLYGLALRHRQSCPRTRITARLLFSEASAVSQMLGESFRTVCDEVTVRFGTGDSVGGSDLNPSAAHVCYAAAGEMLLARAQEEAQALGIDLYTVMQ